MFITQDASSQVGPVILKLTRRMKSFHIPTITNPNFTNKIYLDTYQDAHFYFIYYASGIVGEHEILGLNLI